MAQPVTLHIIAPEVSLPVDLGDLREMGVKVEPHSEDNIYCWYLEEQKKMPDLRVKLGIEPGDVVVMLRPCEKLLKAVTAIVGDRVVVMSDRADVREHLRTTHGVTAPLPTRIRESIYAFMT